MRNKRGRPRRYRWDEWLAKAGQFALRRGVHFPATISLESMAQQVRNAASAHGVAVSIVERGDRLIVEVLEDQPCPG